MRASEPQATSCTSFTPPATANAQARTRLAPDKHTTANAQARTHVCLLNEVYFIVDTTRLGYLTIRIWEMLMDGLYCVGSGIMGSHSVTRGSDHTGAC